MDLLNRIRPEDLPFEEDLLKDAYNLKAWLRYIDRITTAQRPLEFLYFLYERAIQELPGSYKLWKRYLDTRRIAVEKNANSTAQDWRLLNQCYERALVFMHKMPRIWLDYCDSLGRQQLLTFARRAYDRSLRSLPVTQHPQVWEAYVKFAANCGVFECTRRVYQRYLKISPAKIEDYVDFLVEQEYFDEAVRQMVRMLDDGGEQFHQSSRGKNSYQLWTELADLVCEHSTDLKSVDVDGILRAGIQRFTDEVGRLWNALAKYYILLGNFEKARDVYEESLQSVMTVRDFTQIFEAYAEFEEAVIGARLEQARGEEDDVELDLRMARFEQLLDRRPFLVNDVLLRQNPHNVLEWMKRVQLLAESSSLPLNNAAAEKIASVYQTAVKTVDPKKAHGKLQDLWIAFARFYEDQGRMDMARQTFESALKVNFKHPDSLAECYIAYADFELRHHGGGDNVEAARSVLARGTAQPSSRLGRGAGQVDYFDDSLPVQQRLFKSIKLWSYFVDLEESMGGSVAAIRAVYDRVLELKICTPQIIINYATFLEDNDYFEDSFRVYERGIELFGFPIAFDIWNVYLKKFTDRYGGTKLERTRDLYEHAVRNCPPQYAKALYILYGTLEEQHGLAKRALQIYDRACRAVSEQDRMEIFNYYIMKSIQLFGLTSARAVYEKAVETLPEKEARQMALKFIDLEMKLGEVDRARALYGYTSQMCDPRLEPQFWDRWQAFEVQHGNEETFKEMLRVKRTVQSRFNTNVGYLSAQILANRQSAASAAGVGVGESGGGGGGGGGISALVARPSETFIAGGKTVNGRPVQVSGEGDVVENEDVEMSTTEQQNPDEIPIGASGEDEFDDL